MSGDLKRCHWASEKIVIFTCLFCLLVIESNIKRCWTLLPKCCTELIARSQKSHVKTWAQFTKGWCAWQLMGTKVSSHSTSTVSRRQCLRTLTRNFCFLWADDSYRWCHMIVFCCCPLRTLTCHSVVGIHHKMAREHWQFKQIANGDILLLAQRLNVSSDI